MLPPQQLQLGEASYQQGHYAKAAEIFQQLALSAPREALWALKGSLGLAQCHHRLWDEARAEAQYLRTIEQGRAALGEPHALVAAALDGLGKLYLEQQSLERAAALIEESHALRQLAFGAEHPDTAESLLRLAELYTALGQRGDARLYQRARPFYEEALRILRALLDEDARVATAHNCFGYFCWRTKDFIQARASLEEALRLQTKLLPPAHPGRASTLWNLALLHRDQGALTQATALLEEALSLFSQAFSLRHPKRYCALLELGELYRLAGRSQDALALYYQAATPQNGPISSEAKACITALQATTRPARAFSWGAKQQQRRRFTQPARHLSLAPQRLVVTTEAGVHLYELPSLRYRGFIETQLAQEAFLSAEGDLYVLTPERMLHLWRQTDHPAGLGGGRYHAYLGQHPPGPLTMLTAERKALCIEAQTVTLISLGDGHEIAEVTLVADGGELLAPVFSAAPQVAAMAGLLGEKVLLYQLEPLEELDSLETPEGVRALAFSPRGTLYAATAGWIYAYHRGEEAEVRSWSWSIDEASPQLIAVSPDDTALAVSNATGVLLYDTRTHAPLATLPTGPLEQLFFVPGQRSLLTLSQSQEAALWDY